MEEVGEIVFHTDGSYHVNGEYPVNDKTMEDKFGGNKYYLVEWTGLVDKNQKEIFEGDIVKYTASFVPLVEEVYFVDWYQAGFAFKKRGENGAATYLQTSKLEVIGNIYKNPNLLDDPNLVMLDGVLGLTNSI